MADFPDDVKAAFDEFLCDTLTGMHEDVNELLTHLAATAEQMRALDAHCDQQGIGLDSPSLNQHQKRLLILGNVDRLANKLMEGLAAGEPAVALATGALFGESLLKRVAGSCLGLQLARASDERTAVSIKARHAAEVRHSKHGGSRDKAAEMRKAWASGRFSSRDICAEQESGALGLSFATARKALRNTPDPA